VAKQFRGWVRSDRRSPWLDVAGGNDAATVLRRLHQALAREKFTGFAVLTPPGVRPGDHEPQAVRVRLGVPDRAIPVAEARRPILRGGL
jgi:hypothetical protein